MYIKNLRLNKETTTYMPLLIRAVLATRGPVLELGAGLYSTPLLHWLAAENRRKLVTYEKYPEYYEFAQLFKSRTHAVQRIDDWMAIDTKTHWSVVLIDQDSKRAQTAILLKNNADIIILHDSDHPSCGYHAVYPHFTYRYDWTFCKPHTTAVSNTMDVRTLLAPSNTHVHNIYVR